MLLLLLLLTALKPAAADDGCATATANSTREQEKGGKSSIHQRLAGEAFGPLTAYLLHAFAQADVTKTALVSLVLSHHSTVC